MNVETKYAKSGAINIAYEAAGSGLEFKSRGRQMLAGVPGEWEILLVT